MRAHAAARRADATSAARRLRGTDGRRSSSRCSRTSAGLGVDQRHHVLQLVAEAEGAARLVVAAARPQAAGQRLVEQPAVGQQVERRVGRFDLHGAERVLPVVRAPLRARRARPTAAEALHELPASSALRPTPSRKTISRSCPSASSNATCIAAQGSSAGADLAGQARPRMAAGFAQRAVAAEELGAVAGHASASRRRRRRTRPGRRTRCCRRCARSSAPLAGSISVITCIADFGAQVAQHPLAVAGRREPARPARLVAQLQHRELHRRVDGHVDAELGANAVLDVLEDAVAEAVPGDVGRRCRAAGSGVGDQKWPVSSSRR